jgi:hypothetical protein
MAPETGVVNRLGENFLPDAGFAEKQYGRTGRRHRLEVCENITDRLAPVDDPALGLNGHSLAADEEIDTLMMLDRATVRFRYGRHAEIERSANADRGEGLTVVYSLRGVIHDLS